MQGQEVCGSNDRFGRVCKGRYAVEKRFDGIGQEGIVADDFHTERVGGDCDFCSDGTESDDAERFAEDFVSAELRLAFFDHFGDGVSVAGKPVCPTDSADDVTARKQHAAKDKLFDGVCVGAGGVEYDNALFGHAGQRNIVDARTRSCYGKQIVLDVEFRHVGAADKDGVGCFDVVGNVITVVEHVVDFFADRIEFQDFVHIQRFSVSNFFMKSINALTPSTGIAL